MEKPRVLWREREILEPGESTVIPPLTQTRRPEDFTHHFLKRAHHVCLEHCKSQQAAISYSDVTSPSTWTVLVLTCSDSYYFTGTVVSRSPKHRKTSSMPWSERTPRRKGNLCPKDLGYHSLLNLSGFNLFCSMHFCTTPALLRSGSSSQELKEETDNGTSEMALKATPVCAVSAQPPRQVLYNSSRFAGPLLSWRFEFRWFLTTCSVATELWRSWKLSCALGKTQAKQVNEMPVHKAVLSLHHIPRMTLYIPETASFPPAANIPLLPWLQLLPEGVWLCSAELSLCRNSWDEKLSLLFCCHNPIYLGNAAAWAKAQWCDAKGI